jgi:glucokinase
LTLTLGVDVGGTKIAAGLVAADGALVSVVRRDCPASDPEAIADSIADVVAELSAGRDVVALGLAPAGWLDLERAEVMYAPNLAWRAEPLRQLVQQRVAMPTVMENDASSAAWAEYRFGAGEGARVLLMVTIGTGIGGGLVIGGRLFHGGYGVATEPGHMRVVPGGRPCACRQLGCWEAYASGHALSVRARELAQESPAEATVLLDLAGGQPAAIDGRRVSAAAAKGDPAALQSFAELARWIGEGLASLASVLDPDVVVIGGGVSESPSLDIGAVVAAFGPAESGTGHRPVPQIRRAELGTNAGLIGAAALARAAVVGTPQDD